MEYVESRGNAKISDIPKWYEFLSAILKALQSDEVLQRRELEDRVLEIAGITEEQKLETLNSGDSRVLNRIGWAISELYRATALQRPSRGHYRITEIGLSLLKHFPNEVTLEALQTIPAWHEYVPTRNSTAKTGSILASNAILDAEDPAELIAAGIAKFETDVASQLLVKLREGHPEFFELAVVHLLKAMGYGGSENNVRHIGKRSNDGGVDGVIDQDALGLNRVYIQAKRYGESNSVERPDLQKFVGALAGQGATQGVFVTTSSFSNGSVEFVEKIPTRVVLIDGPKLAELMIQYRVGVQVKDTFHVVEIDEDFFE